MRTLRACAMTTLEVEREFAPESHHPTRDQQYPSVLVGRRRGVLASPACAP
jgi:hypothetical protein